MSRLRRGLQSYIAALRISHAKIIVFIEGTDFDPIFYGAIIARYRTEGAEGSEAIELRRSTELPSNAEANKGGSGGEMTLSCASGLWQRYRAKHFRKWRNKKTIVFCVDKDAGDLVGLPDYAPSLVHTPLHSVENHLFLSSKLELAIEMALSLAPGEAKALFKEGQDWNGFSAGLWVEWMLFCILALRIRAQGIPNYSTPTLFNPTKHLGADQQAVEKWFARLQAASGLDVASFNKMRQDLKTFVEQLLEAGEHDRLFKGRWYLDILFSQLCASHWAREARACGKHSLLVAIRSQFELREADYQYYREAIVNALGQPIEM